MKKTFIVLLLLSIVSQQNIHSQNSEAINAVAGGLLAIGAGIAAVEAVKEQLELIAVEQVLNEYDVKDFQLKTSSIRGSKLKDLSNVKIATFEIINLRNKERFILFGFLSQGWINSYGVNYNKITWKNFSKSEWNDLMKAYIETASKKEVSLALIPSSRISAKGIRLGGQLIIEFDKINGDSYYTSDYSEEFKIVFNERSLGLFIKPQITEKENYRNKGVGGDLVQIRNSSIIKAHGFINKQVPLQRNN